MAARLRIPGRRRGTFPVQEAFPAKNRTPLCGLEGNRGLPAALRTGCHGFRFGKAPGTRTLALVFASLTALGLVFEILVMEEVLFSRGENKIGAAIYALEDAILKFRHIYWPRFPLSCVAKTAASPPDPPPSDGYSISRRDFFRFRLRASACFARSFSPGLR